MRERLHSISLFFINSASCSSSNELVYDSPVTCSSEGVVCKSDEDNIIDALTNIPTLEQCRELCLDMVDCQYISYSYENAFPIPNFCQLFSSCDSVSNCSNCHTENIDCRLSAQLLLCQPLWDQMVKPLT